MPSFGAVSTTTPSKRQLPQRGHKQAQGLVLLVSMIVLMWAIEAINSLDSNRLSGDGIYPRNFDRIWGILTSPFIHLSFQHLTDNTVPFAFMGAIIALQGAARLARVTLFVIVIGGLGTWLIAPSGSVTDGASGVVFGYATYLLARGFFNRSVLELLAGAVVGVIWGAALVASLVPHYRVSWQAHVCGGIAGLVAAYAFSDRRARRPAETPAPASAL